MSSRAADGVRRAADGVRRAADGVRSAASHAEWLRSREPEAPAALVTRIAELFAGHAEWDSLPRAEAYIAASEELLRRALHGNAMERACAVDLLAADACVTYAFEAAADQPASIGARAEDAMARIAALAAEFGALQ